MPLYLFQIIPVAQILMPNKEYLTYKGMLRGLKQIIPQFRPRKVHMDYERAPIRAWIEEFNTVVRGCLFHYVKVSVMLVSKLSKISL